MGNKSVPATRDDSLRLKIQNVRGGEHELRKRNTRRRELLLDARTVNPKALPDPAPNQQPTSRYMLAGLALGWALPVAPGRGDRITGRATPDDPLRTEVSACGSRLLGMPGTCCGGTAATENEYPSPGVSCTSRHSAPEIATTAIAAATPAHPHTTGEFLCGAAWNCLAPTRNRAGTGVAIRSACLIKKPTC